jgi:hypothetical protein
MGGTPMPQGVLQEPHRQLDTHSHYRDTGTQQIGELIHWFTDH